MVKKCIKIHVLFCFLSFITVTLALLSNQMWFLYAHIHYFHLLHSV